MTILPNDDQRCLTCGQTYAWHVDNQPRHPFNDGQDGATDFLKRRGGRDHRREGSTRQRGSDGPQIVSPGNDPVLRIALINRGILSPADLVVAEEQLRAALAEVQERSASGEGEVQVGEAAPVDVRSSPEGGPQMGSQPRYDKG